MAFVGYVESVSNLHTSELRSKWLAQLVDEQFKLPTIEKMLEKTKKEMQVMKRSTRFYKRNCISTFSINHSDELCEDMGWKSWRKNTWFSEAFGPYTCQDYQYWAYEPYVTDLVVSLLCCFPYKALCHGLKSFLALFSIQSESWVLFKKKIRCVILYIYIFKQISWLSFLLINGTILWNIFFLKFI